MGQAQSTPFAMLVYHVLKKNRVWVIEGQINPCLKVIAEFNSWSLEEGSLDLETWFRVMQNVEKVLRQGTKVSVDFWSAWALVRSAFSMLQVNGPLLSPSKVKAEKSIHKYDLTEDVWEQVNCEKEKILPDPEPVETIPTPPHLDPVLPLQTSFRSP